MMRLDEACPSGKIAVDKLTQASYTHAERLFSAVLSPPCMHLPAIRGLPMPYALSVSAIGLYHALSPIVCPLGHEAPTPHPPLTLLQLSTA